MTTTIRISGTPIYVLDRGNGGVLLVQGPSHVYLSAAEVGALVSALRPQAATTSQARILRYPQTKEYETNDF